MKNSLGRIAAVVALIMIIGSMLLSTVAPNLATQPNNQPVPTVGELPTIAPTAVTFPTPDPAGPQIERAATYIQPGGLFTIMQPQGWTPAPTNTDTFASVTFVNNVLYSVVHAYLQEYTIAQDITVLDAENSAESLAASWSAYDSWQETNRVVEGDKLTIDFVLGLGENVYLGRHITWTTELDPNAALVLRIVAPENNPELLDALVEAVRPTFHLLPQSFTASFGWTAYTDPFNGYLIRLAPEWGLVDGGVGSIATINNADDTQTLTLGAEDTALADEDAAAAWVSDSRSGVEIVAVEPVTRDGAAGYAVAYSFATADGEPQSGFAVLLDAGERGTVYANLRLQVGDVNLLDATQAESYADVLTMLETFNLLPEDARQTLATEAPAAE